MFYVAELGEIKSELSDMGKRMKHMTATARNPRQRYQKWPNVDSLNTQAQVIDVNVEEDHDVIDEKTVDDVTEKESNDATTDEETSSHRTTFL